MTLIKKNPKTLDSWKKLQSNFNNLSQKKLADYFTEDPNRLDNLSIIWKSFYVDFCKNFQKHSKVLQNQSSEDDKSTELGAKISLEGVFCEHV